MAEEAETERRSKDRARLAEEQIRQEKRDLQARRSAKQQEQRLARRLAAEEAHEARENSQPHSEASNSVAPSGFGPVPAWTQPVQF